MRVLPLPGKNVDLVKTVKFVYIFGKKAPLKLFPLRRGYTIVKQENIKNMPKPFLHKSPLIIGKIS